MILTSMMNVDKYALECDLAETYHIYNMYELPFSKVALFSAGLRDNSRIKMKISGMKISFETLLLAKAVDNLSLLVWSKTKDAQKNRNRPPSIVEKVLDDHKEENNLAFDSGDDFEKARNEILRKGG